MAVGIVAARAAVAAFLAPGNVAGLYTVKRARPKPDDITQRDFFAGAPAGTRSGAICIIHATRQHETSGAVSSMYKRRLDFDIEVELQMRSTQRHAEDARDDFDHLVDAFCARIRSDRLLGTGDVTGQIVWQAAENHLDVDYADFVTTKTYLEFWALARFDLTQYTP